MTEPTSVSWGALKKTAEDATKPLPIDWYEMIIVKAEAKVASTGSNMVSCVLEVTNGPHKTRRVFTNFVLSPDSGFALGIFFRNMAALGLTDEFFAQLEQYPVEQGMSMIADALMNRTARVKVGVRTWQGQQRNECQEFQPLAGVGPVAPGVNVGAPTLGGPGAPTGGPTPPSAPGATPSAPTVGATPQVGQSVPQVPGPPPPPQPAF